MEKLQECDNSVNSQERENEKLKLRREARRRKILENAKSRLEKLNNKQNGDGDGASAGGGRDVVSHEEREYSDPEVEADEVMDSSQSSHSLNSNAAFAELLTRSLNTNVAVTEQRNVFFRRKIHVILSAIIGYISALITGQNKGLYSLSIFAPTGILIALELIFYRERQQPSIVSNFLVLFGMQYQRSLMRWLSVFVILQEILANIGVFVFCFCIITFTLTSFSQRFEMLATIK